MTEFIFNNFVVLVVVMDPIGVAPVFGALTQGMSRDYCRHMALKGTFLSGIILLFFMATGHMLLNALGIGINAFKIAGGLFLLLLSIDMVFARRSGLRSTTKSEQAEAEHREDISVFPLAIPLIAGPGAMTTLVLMMGEADRRPDYILSILLVLIVVLIMTLVALLAARRIMTLMGETGSNVVSRILGILLAALAIQYMTDGIHGSFNL